MPEPLIEQILQTTEIRLYESWSGLTGFNPTKEYVLLYKGNKFEGNAQFFKGKFLYNSEISKKIQVNIPLDKVNLFINHLARCKISNKEYRPYIVIDANDYIRIELKSMKKRLIFSSISYQEDPFPWQLKWGKESYVIDSSCPMQAIKILTPYLKEDTYQRLLAQAQRKVDNFKQKMIKEELEKRSNGEKVKPKNTNRQ